MAKALAETSPVKEMANEASLRQVDGERAEFTRYIGHVSRHSAAFFAGTIFTAIASYVFKVYLARVLGAEELGIYALGMTIVGLVGVFNALGISQAAVRFVSSYVATGMYRELGGFLFRSSGLLVGINVLLAAAMVVGSPWIAVRVYHTPALALYTWSFAAILALSGLNNFFGQVLTGYKDVYRRTVITNFTFTALFVASAVLLISLGAGLRGYLFAQIGASIIVLGLLLQRVWKATPPPARMLKQTPPLGAEVVAFSAAAFGVSFLEFLMGQADKIIIGVYLDARSVGVYFVASTLVAFVPILLQSVNQIFSPLIADLHSRGQREMLGRMFQTLTKWIFGLTLPLAAMVIIFARPLMGIFGSDFESAWPILVIGTLGQLVNCGVGSVGYLLLMSGNQNRLVRIQAASACLMVGLNLALVPRLGMVGAAVAAAVTLAVCNIWSLRDVRGALGLSPYNRSYVRMIAPVAAAVLACWLGRVWMSGLGPIWLAAGVSLIAAYLIFVATAAFVLDSDDRLILTEFVARLRTLVRGWNLNPGSRGEVCAD